MKEFAQLILETVLEQGANVLADQRHGVPAEDAKARVAGPENLTLFPQQKNRNIVGSSGPCHSSNQRNRAVLFRS